VALWLMTAIIEGLELAGIADSLLHRLASFLQIVMISLFLSFSNRARGRLPGNARLAPGATTGLVFLAILLAAAGLIACWSRRS
jgi:hypothetical protein